jgi:hypothetical protein
VSWASVIWHAAEWLILGALTPLTYALGRRFPLRRPHLARDLAVHVGGSLVLCVLWACAGVALGGALRTGRDGPPPLASWLLTSLPWSVFMYFTVLGCVYAFSYFFEAREREAPAWRLAAQLSEARLAALRSQVHPNFLFNSLNAITVLVRDQDTKGAARMLGLLSDVLRTALRTDPSQEVRLEEEVRFVERYLAIEEVRFSDRLRTRIEVDDSLRGAAVPGFVLQPLVENAIRHGIAKRSEPGLVEVRAVRDDGPGPGDRREERWGVGLANTRDRLEMLYPGRGRVELAAVAGGGTVATVRLPYRALEDARDG